ncbi:hypothetical protein CHS0354_031617 [Potamilus streckersoni]|uniref:Peptidase M12B domain-containing protein n=1 Tax=Potamilus streckersoni TaxID=2493646 RepID=A0AAE0VWD8_9BIVA|nr:hypothetical protein CHS0354_031617 [Potamilus streckersoni]
MPIECYYSASKLSELQDVAYYKDRKNGAFVTVRCVKRSNGQCDRIIVSLLYDNMDKSQIQINIILLHFYIFQTIEAFPQRHSTVKVRHGREYIQVDDYLSDISYWDIYVGSKSGVVHGHAMMFTRFDLYDESIKHNTLRGRAPQSGVCDEGRRISVIESRDFFVTVLTAAHELGHSLGAVHDGQGDAISCPAGDLFIMTTVTPDFDPEKPYSRNPWLFSECSVDAFSRVLKDKTCVQNKGTFFNWHEWNHYTAQTPGEAYSLDKQCQFIHGPLSKFCQDEPADICLNVQCTDPNTGECLDYLYNAARGTRCGNNMWCIEGRCVSKGSK